MKHLKSFNESVTNFAKEVRQLCDDSLSYLKDEGFEYYTDFIGMTRANYDEILLFINGSKEIKFVDILPDLQPFIELLSQNTIIKRIEVNFYLKTLNGYELRDSTRSRNAREILTVDKILNGKFDGSSGDYFLYNIPSIISFSFQLEKKRAPLLNRIKSFFSK